MLSSDTPSIYMPAFTSRYDRELSTFGGKLVSSDFWENPLAADDVATRRRPPTSSSARRRTTLVGGTS